MTTLFHSARPVKSTRSFGLGLLDRPARPGPRRPAEPRRPSEEDRRWWAAETDRVEREREGRELDRRAAESLATDALCLGLVPADLS